MGFRGAETGRRSRSGAYVGGGRARRDVISQVTQSQFFGAGVPQLEKLGARRPALIRGGVPGDSTGSYFTVSR